MLRLFTRAGNAALDSAERMRRNRPARVESLRIAAQSAAEAAADYDDRARSLMRSAGDVEDEGRARRLIRLVTRAHRNRDRWIRKSARIHARASRLEATL